ncbi:MAG: hypothetical protein KBE04_05895 [Phycisphaerae bacterium]|nr:hypothetical protein [Phycisphaerae bacterium]
MPNRMGVALVLLAAMGLVGCEASLQTGASLARDRQFTQRGVPARQYLVGGGFKINYTAPADGTVYWVEETTGKILETTSVTEDEDVEFEVNLSDIEPDEFERRIGVDVAKAKMGLYFIPRSEKVVGSFTDRGVPARKYQVGGGLDVAYKAPADGTLYWVDDNSGKILETRVITKGEVAESNRTPGDVSSASGNPSQYVDVTLYFIPSAATP